MKITSKIDKSEQNSLTIKKGDLMTDIYDGLIIIVSHYSKGSNVFGGTVMVTGQGDASRTYDRSIGTHREIWILSQFRPFTGHITLSCDED